MKNIIKIVFPLILAAALLWYVLQKVDISELFQQLAKANYYWVALAISISIISHIIRAARWKIMVEPLGYTPSLINTFMAVMVGYFANIFLPRAGELLRCVALNRSERVPVNEAFGTVVAERAIDFICLLILMGLSLVLEFDRFNDFFQHYVLVDKGENPIITALKNYWIVIAIVIVALAIATKLLWKKIITSPLVAKIMLFITGILQGVFSIINLKNKNLFIIHTVLIWLCYYFMTYLMFYTLPATSGLSMLAGLVILIVGGLGMSAPVSGGIGPFHLMVAGALELFYGLSQKDGIAYAFVIHTSQMVMVIVIGGIFTIINMMLPKPAETVEHI